MNTELCLINGDLRTDNVNDFLKEEEAYHGCESCEAKPDGLLVLLMVVTMMTFSILRLTHLGQEGMREEVEERVPGEGAHRQGYQELDEMLVEDSLHDRDHQDAEHSAQGDQDQGA